MRRLIDSETSRARRIGVTLLLVLFLLPSLAVLFSASASTEAALPACCRTHGKHHCTMGDVGVSQDAGDPSVPHHHLSEHCPFQGVTAASQFSDSFDVLSNSSVEMAFQEERVRASKGASTASFKTFHAHPKRGPPHSSRPSHEA